ncbi:MAG TPA: DUF1841 family protein [Candidatus Acidoferrum sp.]|nr:DUF1841 family protein [Candidatus Acidoferrum sp.]
MTKCVYCQRQKGKRACPALEGAICSVCCGRHRLQEIECPADCPWLGGLAAMRDPGTGTFSKEEFASALDRLLAYADRARAFREEALARFFGDDEPGEWLANLATGYICHGHRGADGRRLIDLLLSAQGRSLRPGETASLVALQRAWASLFEIAGVQVGAGLELRDLLTGESLRVREVSLTSQVVKWDVMFGWVVAFPDHLELTGAACLVPRVHLDRVRAALDRELTRLRRKRPGVADRELVGEVAWAPARELVAAVRGVRMPQLQTTHGEDLLFCKAHYRSADMAAVRARLESLDELELYDDHFTWLDQAGSGRGIAGGPVSLGTIRCEPDGLVLETMSRERHERGRRLLESVLGTLVEHRADSIQSVEAAVEESRKRPPRPERDELPEEVKREVLGQVLRDHYRGWLDQPLPVLAGRSPRQVARRVAGRAQVEALLKDAENHTVGMPGGDTVDFAGMRRELGLSPDIDDEGAGEGLAYGASPPPDPEEWLAADDQEKEQAVEDYHRGLREHPDIPDPRAHAMMHVVVENQIASGHPSEAAEALARLLAAGLTRHEAIHAIGSVVAEQMWTVKKEKRAFDREATARALARLRPADWMHSAAD